MSEEHEPLVTEPSQSPCCTRLALTGELMLPLGEMGKCVVGGASTAPATRKASVNVRGRGCSIVVTVTSKPAFDLLKISSDWMRKNLYSHWLHD